MTWKLALQLVSRALLLGVGLAATVSAHAQATGDTRATLVDPSTGPAPAYVVPGTAPVITPHLTQLPPTTQREYRIGVDDVLSITVWHEPDLSRSAPVLPDGMISLPLIGQVQAAGKTTPQLEGELKASLAAFIKSPEIYVMVAQIRSRHINIIGEVQHPGTFTLMQSMGVLDAIAGAGGLRDFAKKNKIYLLREGADGKRERIAYNYAGVLKGKSSAKDILLQPNDTVVIP